MQFTRFIPTFFICIQLPRRKSMWSDKQKNRIWLCVLFEGSKLEPINVYPIRLRAFCDTTCILHGCNVIALLFFFRLHCELACVTHFSNSEQTNTSSNIVLCRAVPKMMMMMMMSNKIWYRMCASQAQLRFAGNKCVNCTSSVVVYFLHYSLTHTHSETVRCGSL